MECKFPAKGSLGTDFMEIYWDNVARSRRVLLKFKVEIKLKKSFPISALNPVILLTPRLRNKFIYQEGNHLFRLAE